MPELPDQWYLDYLKSKETAAKTSREAAKPILDKMRAAGITKIVFHYDGVGDSGSIEEAHTYKAGSDEPEELDPVPSPLEDFAYAALENKHGGWENDAGAYGDITIDLVANKMTIAHSERYETTTDYTDELDL